MLNETASSMEDRPALRSSVRIPQSTGNALLDELRPMVASVMAIERELPGNELNAEADPQTRSRDFVMMMNPQSRLSATFEGQLIIESEEAYDRLDKLFATINHLPIFRTINGKHVIMALQGRVHPKPRPWWPNAVLFIATIFSTLILGATMALDEIAQADPIRANALQANFFLEIWRGWPYAVSILLILGAHELGHYFAARHHKLAVTLPYFIPLPFFSLFGTMGAAIQLREPMRNRKVLMDVGAAGPLVGMIFAIPVLLIGLATSQVGPISPNGFLEGNSLLYALAKILVFGHFLPAGGVDVQVNQVAWAGWGGLLVTSLNLIPIGQLDGGHIMYSIFGERARRLFVPILVLMIGLIFVNEVWIFWLVIIFLFGRFYATPLDMITPLDRPRRWIGILGLVVFLLTFVPVPLTQYDSSSQTTPRDSALVLPAPLPAFSLPLTPNR